MTGDARSARSAAGGASVLTERLGLICRCRNDWRVKWTGAENADDNFVPGFQLQRPGSIEPIDVTGFARRISVECADLKLHFLGDVFVARHARFRRIKRGGVSAAPTHKRRKNTEPIVSDETQGFTVDENLEPRRHLE